MSDAFLDSSVVIGLVFRNAGEKAACRAALPSDGVVTCSRYVIFEVARGFLRNLIALHNYSFEFESFASLHQAAHSGQLRFKPYVMQTYLGAFSDYFAALERKDGPANAALTLEEFRAKLRGWIRRGWQKMVGEFNIINDLGCREDIPAPAMRRELRLDQRLPLTECGQPTACNLQNFVQLRKTQVEAVAQKLETLPASKKDKETLRRVEALQHLLSVPPKTKFNGSQCHRCGDALICLESPDGATIITKNGKHFEPIATILNKRLILAETARTTRAEQESETD